LKKYHGKNPEWLKTLFPDFFHKASAQSPAADLTTFLQTLLAEQKGKGETMAERLEMALSLMTPEQLIQFRSQNAEKASGGENGGKAGPPKGEKPMSGENPPPPPPKKPRKWL